MATPAPCEVGPKLTRIVAAAGDRLKVFGDILAYADFFFLDEVAYDEKAFKKNLLKPGAVELLARFRAAGRGRALRRPQSRSRALRLRGGRSNQNRRHHPRHPRGHHRQAGGSRAV